MKGHTGSLQPNACGSWELILWMLMILMKKACCMTMREYLMQFQSDILDTPVACADAEELSGIGAAYMAGLSRKIYNDQVFSTLSYHCLSSEISTQEKNSKLRAWHEAVSLV